jgi:hypothetical protein
LPLALASGTSYYLALFRNNPSILTHRSIA